MLIAFFMICLYYSCLGFHRKVFQGLLPKFFLGSSRIFLIISPSFFWSICLGSLPRIHRDFFQKILPRFLPKKIQEIIPEFSKDFTNISFWDPSWNSSKGSSRSSLEIFFMNSSRSFIRIFSYKEIVPGFIF